MLDATDILETLALSVGGFAELAKQTGVVRSAVSNWLVNGIPATRCLRLAEIATERGLNRPFRLYGEMRQAITLEVLMHSKPRPPIEGKKAASAVDCQII